MLRLFNNSPVILRLEPDLQREAVRREQTRRIDTKPVKSPANAKAQAANQGFVYVPDDDAPPAFNPVIKVKIFDASLEKVNGDFAPVAFDVAPEFVYREDDSIDQQKSLQATYSKYLEHLFQEPSKKWKDIYRPVTDEVKNDYKFFFYTYNPNLPQVFYPGKTKDDPDWSNFDESKPLIRYVFRNGFFNFYKSFGIALSLASDAGLYYYDLLLNPNDPPEDQIYVEKLTDILDPNAPPLADGKKVYLTKATEIYVVPRPAINSDSLSDPEFKMLPCSVLNFRNNVYPASTLPPIIHLIAVLKQNDKLFYRWAYAPPVLISS